MSIGAVQSDVFLVGFVIVGNRLNKFSRHFMPVGSNKSPQTQLMFCFSLGNIQYFHIFYQDFHVGPRCPIHTTDNFYFFHACFNSHTLHSSVSDY